MQSSAGFRLTVPVFPAGTRWRYCGATIIQDVYYYYYYYYYYNYYYYYYYYYNKYYARWRVVVSIVVRQGCTLTFFHSSYRKARANPRIDCDEIRKYHIDE